MSATISGYVLATPVKNELSNLPRLLEGLERQTVRPVVWVVVDDHSDDGSKSWLERESGSRPWLVVLDAPEKSDEYLGGHIARIKGWGMRQAEQLARERGNPAEFSGILDADISLPKDHYERLLREFAADPSLGVASSVVASPGEGGERIERFQREDSARGPTQIFRVACLEAIGGLPPWPGFDGAANVKVRARGWKSRCFFDLVAQQERETATRFGHGAGYARKGRYAWFLGVHPLLVLARGAAYSSSRPYTAGYHFVRAYLGEAVKRKPRCPDPEVREYYGLRRLKEAVMGVFGHGPAMVKSGSSTRGEQR